MTTEHTEVERCRSKWMMPGSRGYTHCGLVRGHEGICDVRISERLLWHPSNVGLYKKYSVTRIDEQDGPGLRHYGCEYFVLDLTHDPHARNAALAYASSCHKEFKQLSVDLVRAVRAAEAEGGD